MGVGALIPLWWPGDGAVTVSPDIIGMSPAGDLMVAIVDGTGEGTLECYPAADFIVDDSSVSSGDVTHAGLDTPVGSVIFSPDGDYAVALGGATDILVIVDVRDPTAPSVAGTVDLSTYTPARISGGVWAAEQGIFYCCDATTDDRIYSIDVSDPTQPTVAQVFTDTTNLDKPTDVVLSETGDFLYVGQLGGVVVLNIEDPRALAFVEEAALSDAADWVYGLSWDGDILAGYGRDDSASKAATFVFDITAEGNLTYASTLTGAAGLTGNARGCSLNGGCFTYWRTVTGATQYLRTVDVTDTAAPAQIEEISLAGGDADALHAFPARHVAIAYTSDNEIHTYKGGQSSSVDKEMDHYSLESESFRSVVGQGKPPFWCESRTHVKNLNADLLDGKHASDFVDTGLAMRALSVQHASVGNVGVGEDDLLSWSMPANQMYADNVALMIHVWGKTAANADNKTAKLHFGVTELVTTGALAANNKDWFIEATVVRTGAATQECIAKGVANGAIVSPNQRSGAEDLTAAVTIKVTGEATNNDDIEQTGMVITILPVAQP